MLAHVFDIKRDRKTNVGATFNICWTKHFNTLNVSECWLQQNQSVNLLSGDSINNDVEPCVIGLSTLVPPRAGKNFFQDK